MIILDHRQITLTQGLMETLIDNNCAIVTCGSNHLPVGLMLPLYCNTIQNERFRQQLDSSLPLKKQLWQQTIQAKIHNQAAVLKYTTGEVHNNMNVWEGQVRSGDTENMEARANSLIIGKPYFQGIQNSLGDNLRISRTTCSITAMPYFGQ